MAAILLTRLRWPLLIGWSLVWLVLRGPARGDWAFFSMAAGLLRGPDPLGIYVAAPQLQIGPLALVAGLPLVDAPIMLVHAVLAALGLAALALLGRAWPDAAPLRFLAGGLLAVPCWSFVATSGHLDDALAVLGVTAAAVLVRSAGGRRRALAAGLLLGVAVAAKPWALVALPMLLGLPRHRRAALAAAVAVPALAWAPFVLAHPGTVAALAGFRLEVVPTSGLRLLGVGTGAPGWVRPVQLVVGLAAGTLLARRGAWWAVPLAGLGVRVALDPYAMGYYAGSLAVVALLADGWSRRRDPAATALVLAGLGGPALLALVGATRGLVPFLEPPTSLVVAGLRVAVCGLAVAAVLLPVSRPADAPAPDRPLPAIP